MTMFSQTTALKKIAAMKSRLRIVQGGSSAGKTIAILLLLIDTAQSLKGKTISVVSESYPHLRRGCIKDFKAIMEAHGYWRDARWSETASTYSFETGSVIEFFSADESGKVRGPRRDILFVNEINNLPFETFTQLSIRTNDYIFVDFNPVSSFFIHEEILPSTAIEHEFLKLTYLDNESLSENIVRDIEARKGNARWFKVYGLGELGEAGERIYSDWAIIDDKIPHEARLERRGLDFGYSQDPCAIVAAYRYNGGWILDEECFRVGMKNREIAEFLKLQPEAMVIADSAEPKSIDELREYGILIVGADKGPGSVNRGIQYVQDQRISVTKQSTNLIKEYRNYMWAKDRDGKVLDVPEGGMDHCLDAVRYCLASMSPTDDGSPYVRNRRPCLNPHSAI
jgi:phage terminase large subunit